MVDARDLDLLQRAFRLAERGRGQTSPNPLVGAVVAAADGTILGEGYHHKAGTPHAEVHALNAAGERARGATLYCTLEPCCHTGRTGPCAERIAAAGIIRVVAGATDPNPRVAGGGFAYLTAHGIAVEADIAPRQTARQNAAFFTFMRERRPFVLFKAAVSLDGRIAAGTGTRTQISGMEAQRDTQRLRSEMDGIAVGSGTVLADDPVLTVRDVYRELPFTRIIFDRRLRTPPTARLFTTRDDGPIVVLTRCGTPRRLAEGSRRPGPRRRAYRAAGGHLHRGGNGEARRAWPDISAARGRGGTERCGLGCRYDRSRAAVHRAHRPWTRGRAAARRAPSGNRRPVSIAVSNRVATTS